MVETTGLHVFGTADNSQLDTEMRGSIGLLDQFGRKLVQTVSKEDQAAAAKARLTRSYNRLARNIDPVLRQQQDYTKGLALIDKALQSEVINTEQAIRAKQQLAIAYKQTDTAMGTFNTQIRTSRFHTANLAAQFNDIGVMMASGQSPFILAVQQGTQITQVLQAMGGTAKEQLGALAVAFRAIISPTALVTIGVIAGAAALVQWATSAGEAEEETDNFKDSIDMLQSISGQASKAFDILTADAIELANRFGDAAAEAKRLAEEEALLAAARLRRELSAQIGLAKQTAAAYGTLETNFNRVITTAEATKLQLDSLALGMKLSGKEVATLSQAFGQVGTAVGLEQEQAAINNLRKAYSDLGMSVQDMPATFQEALSKSNEFRIEMLEAERQIALAQNPSLYRDKPGGGGRGGGTQDREAERQQRMRDQILEEDKIAKDRLQAEIERMQDEFKTKEELELEFYYHRQAMLEEAYEKRLLTEQQYNEMIEQEKDRHEQKMAALERARQDNTLRHTASFFGQVADILAQGNKKMFQISKIFAAGEALINAWRAFNQVLADPTLPWFLKKPMAALTLASGLMGVASILSAQPGGGGNKSASADGGGPSNAGQLAAPAAASPTTAVNINVRGQVFDRGAVVGLIEQINEAIGDGARIRAT